MKLKKQTYTLLSLMLIAAMLFTSSVTVHAIISLDNEAESPSSTVSSAISEAPPTPSTSSSASVPEEKEEPSSAIQSFTIIFQYPEILTADGTPHPLSGREINRQQIPAGHDAIPPEGFGLPDGYLFAGWDNTQLNSVHEDLVVTALLSPTSSDEPEPSSQQEIPVPAENIGGTIAFVLRNPNQGNAVLADLNNWNFFTMPVITVEFTVMLTENTVPNQKVVLTAPQGMDFSIDVGQSPGIKSIIPNQDNTQVTFIFDIDSLMGTSSITASITLKGKGVSLADRQLQQKSIAIYKTLYHQAGRPSFDLKADYLVNNSSKGISQITFTPPSFTSAQINPFNRFGVHYANNSVDPTLADQGLPSSIYFGRSLAPYVNYNYSSKMNDISFGSLVLRQQQNTDSLFYEPVWDVSAKLYLPDIVTIQPTDTSLPPTGQLLHSDAEGRYVQLGENGAPVANAYSLLSVQDSGMVMWLNKNLGFALTNESFLLDPAYRGQLLTGSKIVIRYKTVDSAGHIVSGTQVMDQNTSAASALKFNITPSVPVDWMRFGMFPGYVTSGFTILSKPSPDPDRFITLATYGVNPEYHSNETHKGGTLSFLNNGNYYINSINLPAEGSPTSRVGAMTAEYYTSAEPQTPKPAPIVDNKVEFGEQDQDNYVTKVVFTFVDGHTGYLNDINSKFTFDLVGFSGLAANQPKDANGNYSDESYSYSKLTAVLEALGGCQQHNENTYYSLPAVLNHKHTYVVPVRISLQEQDVLTMVTRGAPRTLTGNTLLAVPSPQIYVMLNYDTRNAEGKYAEDPTVRTVYHNFRIDFGTKSPYEDPELTGKDSSQLMLQRIKGTVSINGFVHYTNGQFVYTTNLNPNPHTLTLGDKGTPDAMTGQSGTVTANINLANGEYLTSLVFTADKFAISAQAGTTLTNIPPGAGYSPNNPQVLSGKYRNLDATYWNWLNASNNSFTFSTINSRSFPDGTPILHNKAYHFYAEMTADNMNTKADHVPRRAIVLPESTHPTNFLNRFQKYSPITPMALTYSGFTDAYTQGNPFEVTIARTKAYPASMMNGDIWLEMRPDFIYRSNNKNLHVTQKIIDGKVYLHIQEPDKTLYTNTNPLKITLFSQVPTPGSVQIFTNAWLDYTDTVLNSSELMDEPPYGIPLPAYTGYDSSAPPFHEGPQYLMRTTVHGKITINKGSMSGVRTTPRAGAVLGSAESDFLAYIRPSITNQLALNTVVDSSDNTTNKSTAFDLTYNIPNKTRAQSEGKPAIDFPLYINGLPFKTFGNSAATFTVYYSSDDLRAEASAFPPDKYKEIHTVEIRVDNLVDAMLGFEIPLMTDAPGSSWSTGKAAVIDGYYYRTEAGVPPSGVSTPTDVVTWKMENIDKNSISGSIFYDFDYSGDLSGNNLRYTGKKVTVNLYRQEAMDTPFRSQDTTNGTYSFTDLPDGSYRVGIVLPRPFDPKTGGYKFSSQILTSTTGNNFHPDGFTDPILLEDFRQAAGVNAGITYNGILEVIMLNDENGSEITRQYIDLHIGEKLEVLTGGICGPELHLPPDTAPAPGQPDYSYTPTAATWDTLFKSTSLRLKWAGPLYTISFEYKDTLGNPVAVEPDEMLAPIEARGNQDASVAILPPSPVDTLYTRYLGYSIGSSPPETQSPALIPNLSSDTTITLVYKVRLPVPITFHATKGSFANDSPLWELTSKHEEDTLQSTEIAEVFPPVGYTLSGWAPEENGQVVNFPFIIAQSNTRQNLNFYAVWQPVKTLVEYDGNGGLGEMPGTEVLYDQNITLPANRFTRTGYHFSGWSIQPAGSINYTDCQNIDHWNQTRSVKLYAQWTAITCTLTFEEQNGNPPQVQQLEYGQKAKKPKDAVKAGHRFIGWNTHPNGSGEYIDPETIQNLLESLTLYAIYDPIPPSSSSLPPASSSLPPSSSCIPPVSSSVPPVSSSSPPASSSGASSSSVSSSSLPASSHFESSPSHNASSASNNPLPGPSTHSNPPRSGGSAASSESNRSEAVSHQTAYSGNSDRSLEKGDKGQWYFKEIEQPSSKLDVTPQHWALVNLLAALFSTLLALSALFSILRQKAEESADNQPVIKAFVILIGGLSVVLLLFTQNFRLPMILLDNWTLLMLLLALSQIFLIMLLRKAKKQSSSHNQ